MTSEPEKQSRLEQRMEEHWRNLGLQQRWTLIVLTIQATAAAGTFVAALVGLYSVSPIITYRLEQQERSREAQARTVILPETTPVTARFVKDVYDWWTGRVESYQQILDMIQTGEEPGTETKFEIMRAEQIPGVPESTSDMLVVTGRAEDGSTRVVEAPINENAMPLTQYIQYKINHGAFSDLEGAQREQVEAAVARYMSFYMVPGVPPPYVGASASLDEIRSEIQSRQSARVDANKKIQALNAVIEVAMLH